MNESQTLYHGQFVLRLRWPSCLLDTLGLISMPFFSKLPSIDQELIRRHKLNQWMSFFTCVSIFSWIESPFTSELSIMCVLQDCCYFVACGSEISHQFTNCCIRDSNVGVDYNEWQLILSHISNVVMLWYYNDLHMHLLQNCVVMFIRSIPAFLERGFTPQLFNAARKRR